MAIQGEGNQAENFSQRLSSILTETYQNIMRVEERALTRDRRLNLNISELHLIEYVGRQGDRGAAISQIARRMDVTRPTATITVNKLVEKGYVEKRDCPDDGRVVRVFLTREGKKIDRFHQYFHRKMVREVSGNFTDEERRYLLAGIEKLNRYLKKSMGEE